MNMSNSKTNRKMKAKAILIIASMMGIYSCTSSSYTTSSRQIDDVYFSESNSDAIFTNNSSVEEPVSEGVIAKEYESITSSTDEKTQSNSEERFSYDENTETGSGYTTDPDDTERYRDESGNTYVTNNYYGDYYDYEYSSRLRRFHRPSYYGYYHSYYTNSYYYDYHPHHWGLSIYLGYNFWYPPVSVSFGWGSPGYYGSSWYGYSPFGWHSPLYPSYYGSGYYAGYNNGYWNGYYQGYYNSVYGPYGYPHINPYYCNTYDGSLGYYYGPRSNGSGENNNPSQASGPRTIHQSLYQTMVSNDSPRTPVIKNDVKEPGKTPVHTASPGNNISEGVHSTYPVKGNNTITEPIKGNNNGEVAPSNNTNNNAETSPVKGNSSEGAVSPVKDPRPNTQPVKSNTDVNPVKSNPTPKPRPYQSPSYEQPSTDSPKGDSPRNITSPSNSTPRGPGKAPANTPRPRSSNDSPKNYSGSSSSGNGSWNGNAIKNNQPRTNTSTPSVKSGGSIFKSSPRNSSGSGSGVSSPTPRNSGSSGTTGTNSSGSKRTPRN